ncbi:MAG TPA: hypothetical protein VGK16_08145 [Candidatus Limnocylindrales bacterium]|jgi:hypothetical protein
MTTHEDRASRRAVLGMALGAGAAAVAAAVGHASPVSAADGGNTVLGAANEAATLTKVTNTAGGAAFAGYCGPSGSPYGALGMPGYGVWGQADGTGIGVFGTSAAGNGVYGSSASAVGVRATSTSGRGLHATSDTGFAVEAECATGTAVRAAVTTSGFALATTGRVKHGQVSGVKSISAGRTSVTISPGVDVTSGSFVLLTPKANIGSRALWYTTDPTNNRITIRMSSSRSTSTLIAWLMLG